jgi:hypothetical protein
MYCPYLYIQGQNIFRTLDLHLASGVLTIILCEALILSVLIEINITGLSILSIYLGPLKGPIPNAEKIPFFPNKKVWISQFSVAKYLHVQKIPTVEETQSKLPLFVIYTGNQNQNYIDSKTPENQNLLIIYWMFVFWVFSKISNLSSPGPSPKKIIWEPWYRSIVLKFWRSEITCQAIWQLFFNQK